MGQEQLTERHGWQHLKTLHMTAFRMPSNKKALDRSVEGFASKHAAGCTACIQTLVASGNPAAMEKIFRPVALRPCFSVRYALEAIILPANASGRQHKCGRHLSRHQPRITHYASVPVFSVLPASHREARTPRSASRSPLLSCPDVPSITCRSRGAPSVFNPIGFSLVYHGDSY